MRALGRLQQQTRRSRTGRKGPTEARCAAWTRELARYERQAAPYCRMSRVAWLLEEARECHDEMMAPAGWASEDSVEEEADDEDCDFSSATLDARLCICMRRPCPNCIICCGTCICEEPKFNCTTSEEAVLTARMRVPALSWANANSEILHGTGNSGANMDSYTSGYCDFN